ncbi:hypothetical protein [Deinococcus alpinitundrae]|uniref:hypothetical protein n=1 Tax=Deinococcus alpinitundrae TaxID=468913 RepID=UPI00137ABEC6|nr:hypothetical protein [Deinococcus alpinitundrae]
MRLITRPALTRAALVAAFSLSTALAVDLSGTYTVTGTNPDGTLYRGRLIIKKVGPDLYTMNWNVGETYIGTGLYKNGYLAAGYTSEEDDFYGVSMYALEGSKTLRGIWTACGSVQTGVELAQR